MSEQGSETMELGKERTLSAGAELSQRKWTRS
jgi:hypothetical protein